MDCPRPKEDFQLMFHFIKTSISNSKILTMMISEVSSVFFLLSNYKLASLSRTGFHLKLSLLCHKYIWLSICVHLSFKAMLSIQIILCTICNPFHTNLSLASLELTKYHGKGHSGWRKVENSNDFMFWSRCCQNPTSTDHAPVKILRSVCREHLYS